MEAVLGSIERSPSALQALVVVLAFGTVLSVAVPARALEVVKLEVAPPEGREAIAAGDTVRIAAEVQELRARGAVALEGDVRVCHDDEAGLRLFHRAGAIAHRGESSDGTLAFEAALALPQDAPDGPYVLYVMLREVRGDQTLAEARFAIGRGSAAPAPRTPTAPEKPPAPKLPPAPGAPAAPTVPGAPPPGTTAPPPAPAFPVFLIGRWSLGSAAFDWVDLQTGSSTPGGSGESLTFHPNGVYEHVTVHNAGYQTIATYQAGVAEVQGSVLILRVRRSEGFTQWGNKRTPMGPPQTLVHTYRWELVERGPGLVYLVLDGVRPLVRRR